MNKHLLLILCLLLPFIVPAQPGSLDLNFGDGGVVVVFPEVGEVWDVAMTNDGKVLATGSGTGGARLRRYLPDGTLDNGFGVDGSVSFQGAIFPRKIAIQPDGRIVLIGNASSALDPARVVRLLENGELDPSFGDGGFVDVTLFTATNFYVDVKVLPDGSIVLAGSGRNLPGEDMRKGMLLRLNADGSWNTEFGNNGVVMIEQDLIGTFFTSVQQDQEGRLVVGGHREGVSEAFITRLLPDGTIDPSFGTNGMTTISGPSQGKADLAADGSIHLMTLSSVDSQIGHLNTMRLGRFSSNGTQMMSYGDNGWHTHYNDVSYSPDAVINVLADGTVVGIVSYHYWLPEFTGEVLGAHLVHLDQNGALSTSFGGAGWMAFEDPQGHGLRVTSMAMNDAGWVFGGARHFGSMADREGIILMLSSATTGTAPGSSTTAMRVVRDGDSYLLMVPDGSRFSDLELYDALGRRSRLEQMDGSTPIQFRLPAGSPNGAYILKARTAGNTSFVRFLH